MLLSAIATVPLILYIRRTVELDPRLGCGQMADIVMNSVDVGTDVLFIIEAYEKGATALAHLSSVCLVGVCTLNLLFTLKMVYHFAFRDDKDLLDRGKMKDFSCTYALIVLCASFDIELVQLFPWRSKEYDGYPRWQDAKLATILVLAEDLPQLILELVYMTSVEVSTVASISLVTTLIDLAWRGVKRFISVVIASSNRQGSVASVAPEPVPMGLPVEPVPVGVKIA